MPDRRRLLSAATAFVLAPALSISALAAGPEVNLDGTGLALEGYDPVAYFVEGRAVPGDPGIVAHHAGATYHFAHPANQVAFTADPQRYLPRYGGYCAYAAANGYKANGDPRVWKIVDGRLYLNYSPAIARRWAADQDAMIADADRNWPQIAGRPAG